MKKNLTKVAQVASLSLGLLAGNVSLAATKACPSPFPQTTHSRLLAVNSGSIASSILGG